jgi:hypothetical protein
MEDGQEWGDFRIEYEYQSSPEGSQGLCDALDLVVALLLDDVRRFPSSSSQAPQPDGAE